MGAAGDAVTSTSSSRPARSPPAPVAGAPTPSRSELSRHVERAGGRGGPRRGATAGQVGQGLVPALIAALAVGRLLTASTVPARCVDRFRAGAGRPGCPTVHRSPPCRAASASTGGVRGAVPRYPAVVPPPVPVRLSSAAPPAAPIHVPGRVTTISLLRGGAGCTAAAGPRPRAGPGPKRFQVLASGVERAGGSPCVGERSVAPERSGWPARPRARRRRGPVGAATASCRSARCR